MEALQATADAERDAVARQAASTVVLTQPRTAIQDARDALFDIPADLFGNTSERTSLREILTHDNRLRGLGVMCLAVGILTYVIESLL